MITAQLIAGAATAWHITLICQKNIPQMSFHYHQSPSGSVLLNVLNLICVSVGCVPASTVLTALTMHGVCMGHVEHRCPLHGPAEKKIGSLTATTSFSPRLLPTTLAHLCLSSVSCASYPALIVLS